MPAGARNWANVHRSIKAGKLCYRRPHPDVPKRTRVSDIHGTRMSDGYAVVCPRRCHRPGLVLRLAATKVLPLPRRLFRSNFADTKGHAMASNFTVRSAEGYEQLMGRWSKKLALPFIEFAGIADEEHILDVGCGNGSLTFSLLRAANVSEIAAIDYSPIFVEEVTRLSSDPRITPLQGDATALPFDDNTFDRSLSLLVLHFVPGAEKAIGEMRRVVRPGGVVAAAVWDHLGGMPAMRMMLDTAAMLDESGQAFRQRFCFQPMMAPDEMKNAFISQGLVDVEETSLLIRMTYKSFDDYWIPIAEGEGPLGGFLAGSEPAMKAKIKSAVRAAYEAGNSDGPRSFAAVAWACRGVV